MDQKIEACMAPMTGERSRKRWRSTAALLGVAMATLLLTGSVLSEPKPAGQESTKYVLVPGNTHTLGDDRGRFDEKPQVQVRVSAFEIAVTEVSNGEFEKFVAAAGYKPEGPWRWGYPKNGHELPVRFVTWKDAEAYTKWAGCRLPTEAEWTAASRGIEPRTLKAEGKPLGDEPVAVNAGEARGPLKLLHMEDNVSEWVADWYYRHQYQTYAGAPMPVDPKGPKDGESLEPRFLGAKSAAGDERSTLKVARGPSWASIYNDQLRLARRRAHNPNRYHNDVGFRCAKDAARRGTTQ